MMRRKPIDDAPQRQTSVPSPITKTNFSHSTWLWAIMLVALTFLAYLPALQCGFIWDDDKLVINNPLVRRADGLYRFWCTTQAPDYWPLTSTTWWLEWRLWGKNPLGYHAVNVILHALSTLLWWRILTRLKIPGAWLAAAVFAVHPVNVESVAWIAERKNTLAMFFFALTCLLYLKFEEKERWRWYWIGVGTFALALLSKTAVAPLPLILLGIAWWRRGRIERRDLMRSLPFFGVAGLLGSVTVWFQYHRAIADIVRQDSFWSRLAGAGWAVWFYLSKAMVPVNLCFVYPRWQIDPKNIFSYVPALLVAAVLVVCYCNRRGWGNHGLLALGYYVALLIPALGFINIYFMRYSLVADHWQYYSIIGLIALVVSAGTVIAQRGGTWGRNLGTLAAAAMLVALGVTTWKQQHIYMNMEMLWRDTLAKNPNAWLAQNNLGVLLADRGNLSEAMEHCEQALRIEPDYSESHFNLGNALFKAGKVQEAIGCFKQALRIKPDLTDAHNNLGNALLQAGEVREAIEHWEQALRINPDLAETHYNLGIALVQLGRTQEGIEHYQQALRIQPDYAKAHNNLGNALVQLDRLQEAIEHCEQALRIKPDFPEAHNNLGTALARVGKVQEAIGHYKQALRIKPDFPEAHNNLGIALARVGKVQEAVEHWEQALRINPDYAEAHNNLGLALEKLGRVQEAIQHYEQALRIKPDFVQAQNNLARARTVQ